jgi:uncharacterized protein YjbJ (UPF0337 family)
MGILGGTAARKDTAISGRNSDSESLWRPTAGKIALRMILCLGFLVIRVGRSPANFAGDKAMGINKDQVEGRVKEAAGKVQEVAGKTVGSTTQQVKGAANKAAGAAQAKYGDVKNDINKNSKQGR